MAGRMTQSWSEWLRENFYSSPANVAMTVLGLGLVALVLGPAIDWAILRGVWSGTTREACLVPDAGACWPFIAARGGQIIYGTYDVSERWRVDLVFALGTAGLIWAAWPGLSTRRAAILLMAVAFPLLAFVLLTGGALGLPEVPSSRWGGLMLTLVVSVTGIAASLPLGILLALGRQSNLPVVKWASIAFIEFVRGVPLITILFMASNMLPFFLPQGVELDKLARALIVVALFASAYMAETIRGGLQAIPRGQYEAAEALGLGYWPMMILIILPQALRLVIPGIVNNFIGLFKDTTLVSIIGLFDLLGVIDAGIRGDDQWKTPNTPFTGYLFAGLVFWVFCFGMSRYSQSLERRLAHTPKQGTA